MTKAQIEALLVGVAAGVVGVGLGLGPLAWRVVETKWLPVPVALGVGVVLLLGALGVLAAELPLLGVGLLVVSAAFLVLGATSVTLGTLAGPVTGGLYLLVAEYRRLRREASAPLDPDALFEESFRLDKAAQRAAGGSMALRRVAAMAELRAIEDASAGHVAHAWDGMDVSAAVARAADEVEDTRRRMLARRDLLGAAAVQGEVRRELSGTPRRLGGGS